MPCLHCGLVCPLANHITFVEAQTPPLSVRSLGLLGKVKLLCLAFKALRDAVLAQCPSLSAHCCPTWCSSTHGLLRHSRTHVCAFALAIPSTWGTFPTVAHPASSHSPFKPPCAVLLLCEFLPTTLVLGWPLLAHWSSGDGSSF